MSDLGRLAVVPLLFVRVISNLKPSSVEAKLCSLMSKSTTHEPSAVVSAPPIRVVVEVVDLVVVVVASVVVVVASVVVVVASVVSEVVVVASVVASVVVVVASVVVVVASVVVSSVSVVFSVFSVVASVVVAIVSTTLRPKKPLTMEDLSRNHNRPMATRMIATKVMSAAIPGSFFLFFLLTVVTGEIVLLSCEADLGATVVAECDTPLVAATGCLPLGANGEG